MRRDSGKQAKTIVDEMNAAATGTRARGSLKRNLIANYAGQAWAAIIGLAFVPLYIHYLGIEAYGLIGLFAVLQAWLTLLDLGMSSVLSREMARFVDGRDSPAALRDLLRSVEIICFLIAVLVAIAVWLGSEWLATHWLRAEQLKPATVAQAFQMMGIVTSLRFLEDIYRSCINGLQRQVLLNVINAVMATMRSAGAAIILIWVSNTIEAFFAWQAALSMATIVVLFLATYRSLPSSDRPARFSIEALKTVAPFAVGLLGITLLSLLLSQIDKILLSRLLTLSTFGYYTLAGVAASALALLIYPIANAWNPRLVELVARNDETSLAATYHLGSQLIAVGAGSVALTMIFFPSEFLLLWTHNQGVAENAAMLVSVMTIGNLLASFMVMPYKLQLAYGWTTLTVRANLVALVFIVPAIWWVTPRFGALGAAWIWVTLNSFFLIFCIGLMHRRILKSQKWTWYRNDVAAPLFGGMVAVVTVRLLLPKAHSLVGLGGTLVLAGGATLVGAALGAPAVRNMLGVWLSRRSKHSIPL